jgi:HTH-type transcriptional regulator, competence development regulator
MATPFGKLVRKLRIEHDLTLKNMADEFGFSSAYLSALEMGDKNVTEDTVNKVSEFFKLSIQDREKLSQAAIESNSAVKIPMDNLSAFDRTFVASFARRYSDLSQETKQAISELLYKENSNEPNC